LDAEGCWQQDQHTFGAMTADLLALSDWLLAHGVTHVAMESTGEYWKPVFNILESNFEVILVNAHHMSKVPGRKTDQSDAEWIAELMQCGLLKASFIPPVGQRELRDLTRYRSTFVHERSSLVNRVQKALEGANIKLASVATDIMGKSGRAILAALIEGTASPEQMADLSLGRLRAKHDQMVKALEGRVKAHHRFVLTELLCQIDNLDETLERFDAQIAAACGPYEAAVETLDAIPGVGPDAAQIMVSEMGVDMSRFPTEGHISAWAGVAPGNNESGGKRLGGRRRKGNKALGAVLNQCAWSAIRAKDNFLRAKYYHLVPRIGKKKALLAVAHAILVIAYHLLKDHTTYHELGGDYYDAQNPKAKARRAKRYIKELERQGYQVTAPPVAATG
jgi:transposase